jgi:hypothetical protein
MLSTLGNFFYKKLKLFFETTLNLRVRQKSVRNVIQFNVSGKRNNPPNKQPWPARERQFPHSFLRSLKRADGELPFFKLDLG